VHLDWKVFFNCGNIIHLKKNQSRTQNDKVSGIIVNVLASGSQPTGVSNGDGGAVCSTDVPVTVVTLLDYLRA